MPTFEELLDSWDGEQAVIHRDRESGGWIFICMHSTQLSFTLVLAHPIPADHMPYRDRRQEPSSRRRESRFAPLQRWNGKSQPDLRCPSLVRCVRCLS